MRKKTDTKPTGLGLVVETVTIANSASFSFCSKLSNPNNNGLVMVRDYQKAFYSKQVYTKDNIYMKAFPSLHAEAILRAAEHDHISKNLEAFLLLRMERF